MEGVPTTTIKPDSPAIPKPTVERLACPGLQSCRPVLERWAVHPAGAPKDPIRRGCHERFYSAETYHGLYPIGGVRAIPSSRPVLQPTSSSSSSKDSVYAIELGDTSQSGMSAITLLPESLRLHDWPCQGQHLLRHCPAEITKLSSTCTRKLLGFSVVPKGRAFQLWKIAMPH